MSIPMRAAAVLIPAGLAPQRRLARTAELAAHLEAMIPIIAACDQAGEAFVLEAEHPELHGVGGRAGAVFGDGR
ncbi:hypothetical protein ACIBG8_09410 [Nonomuraea sp. NPDC050556]|uniref:hypothetical protein n=1 Tax=Nonomuraea sp. NPDC050556 TaxID=3364369 RepID=UPI0037A5EF04